MKLLKRDSSGDAVVLLQELLGEYGYVLPATGVFDTATEEAVYAFQAKYGLTSDGIVYTQTWSKLLTASSVTIGPDKFLTVDDLGRLAGSLGVEVAVIKAVNEVESQGKGFHTDGTLKLLFEGHVFWKELKARGIDPNRYAIGNEDILYQQWTNANYRGGEAEYRRLEKAIALFSDSRVATAAFASTSWGLYQLMGYHFQALGYDSVIEFVGAMRLGERRQLDAFGRFLVRNNLVEYLKKKQWTEFARQYNGPSFAANRYDQKLEAAYERYAAEEARSVAPARPVLRRGSTGVAVRELQAILSELDYPVSVTGEFDSATERAVKAFQAKHVDKHQQPLTVDGAVGPLTWWALENPRPYATGGDIAFDVLPPMEHGESPLGRAALKIAIAELKAGAGEVGGNNKGLWVRKYMEPAGLSDGYPWCAAFVSWCFLQAVGGNRQDMPFHYSAGARAIFNQLKQQGRTFTADDDKLPKPGDIVCWWRTSLASGNGHIGLVHHCKDGFLYTIEGNKAANVAGFSYVKSRMDKLLGFGRVL